MSKFYLKPNVQIDVLINQWTVTMPMNAPIPASYFTKQQVKIMESYIESPEDHIILANDPAFVGGPFINYSDNKVAEIKKLLANIIKNQAQSFELIEGIEATYKLLENMQGHSLTALYAQLPECLRGKVELVYDLQHRPIIRFIERMFYNDTYYNPNTQSTCLSLIDHDVRPFVLSTPKLIGNTEVQLKIPFASEKYDFLAKLRETPHSLEEIMQNFPEVAPNKQELFKSFFSADAPKSKYTKPDSEQLRVRYFGHASMLVEYHGVSVLIDPFLSYDYITNLERYTIIDLPEKIDYVLITHGHLDHVVLETLLQIRYKVSNIIVPKNSGMCIADPSLKLLFQKLGFTNIHELEDLEELQITNDFTVVSIPFLGEHHDLAVRGKNAYVLKARNKKLYFAADSANLDPLLYQGIHQIIGDIDVAFCGMECDGAPLSWFYGPLVAKPISRVDDYSRQGSASNSEQALDIVETLKCKEAYIYAMGLEPWLAYILGLNYKEDSKQLIEANKFVKACEETGIKSKILYCKDEFIF